MVIRHKQYLPGVTSLEMTAFQYGELSQTLQYLPGVTSLEMIAFQYGESSQTILTRGYLP